MAQQKLTTKGMIIMFFVLSIVAFGIGYGVWKVSGYPNLAETYSEAGGNQGGGGGKNSGKKNKTSCEGHWAGDGSGFCDEFLTKRKEKQDAEPPPPKICACASFPDACGKDCTFPAEAQVEVNRLAEASGTCQIYIAMCAVKGRSLYYEKYEPGQKCWGKQEQCKNPISQVTCACEGGGLISPSERTPATVGDEVVFSGFAYDADGIDTNSIAVSVDGVVVGNATAVDACAAGGDASICSQYAGKKPVIWSYVHTVTEGSNTFSAVWKDAKGYEGDDCRTTTNLTGEKIVGDWAVSKSGGKICVDNDPNNVYVELSYTISVTNRSTSDQQIDKIVDQLDSKVLESYILLETISPSATVSGNVITWTLEGDDAIFSPNETKTFVYKLKLPENAFGTYDNVATIYPTDGESIEVNESVIASCDVPDTGLLDNTIGKMFFGLMLVFAGLAYLNIDGIENSIFGLTNGVRRFFGYEERVKRSRERFEKRMQDRDD